MLTLTSAPDTNSLPAEPAAAHVLESLTIPIEDATMGWVVKAKAWGNVPKTVPRGAVVTFQFVDRNGKALDAPASGFSYSPHFKRRFHYVPVGSQSIGGISLRPLLPPARAHCLELHLHRWVGVGDAAICGELRADPYAYALADLSQLEAVDSHAAERIAWHWLAARKTDRQYLLEIQAFAWRTGAARLLREACHLLEHAPEARGYMRHQSRYGLAALAEMEDWLPLAPNPPIRTQDSLPHVVLHLSPRTPPARNVYDASILATMQYEQGLKPVVVVPCEYAADSDLCRPYKHQIRDGVEYVELSCLSRDAREKVKRTDLLRLDTLLASYWVTQRRVGVIHAHIGRSGYDLALRALALGMHYQLPVVMQWQEPGIPHPIESALSPPPDSEWSRRAYRQQLRCATKADAVLVADAWQAALLRRAGIPRDRVFITPPWALPTERTLQRREAAERRWITYLDLSHVSRERVDLLAKALVHCKSPELELYVTGLPETVGRIEEACASAAIQVQTVLPTGVARLCPDLVIRIEKKRFAGHSGWLSDLEALYHQGVFVVAESTPQSECVVRDAQRGLTFDLSDTGSLAHSLRQMAQKPAFAQLSTKLWAHLAVQAPPLIVENAYRYALCGR